MKVQGSVANSIQLLQEYADYLAAQGITRTLHELLIQLLASALHADDCAVFWAWVKAHPNAERIGSVSMPESLSQEIGPQLARAVSLWVAYSADLGCPTSPLEVAREMVVMSLDDDPGFRAWRLASQLK